MAIMSTLNGFDIVDNTARNGITTAGTGAAYTATVPGITSLKAGANFTMIPHTISTSVAPTLNVNGLGAKSIRRRISNSTSSTVAGGSDGWLAANKPVGVTYDGTFWIVDFTQPNASDLYGNVSASRVALSDGTNMQTAWDSISPSFNFVNNIFVGSTVKTVHADTGWCTIFTDDELVKMTGNKFNNDLDYFHCMNGDANAQPSARCNGAYYEKKYSSGINVVGTFLVNHITGPMRFNYILIKGKKNATDRL